MPTQRTAPRSSGPRLARRSRLRFRTAIDRLEDRNLLTISALSQYHSFSTGVASGPVLLATFTDSVAAPSGHDAQINWGDGSTSAGTIAADPVVPGQYRVTGDHTFTDQGTHQVAVTITNVATTDSRTVSWVLPSLIPEPVVTTVAVSGLSVGSTVADVRVATFTDPSSVVTAANFSARVTWGDGEVNTGTITADPDVPGQYIVTASKPSAYMAAGDLTMSVDVSVLHLGSGYGWHGAAGMPEALGFVRAASTGGLIYQIGGSYGVETRQIHSYDPATNTWTRRADYPNNDSIQAAETGPDGKIYVAGHDYGDGIDRISVYDPATDSWTTGPGLSIPSAGFQMTIGPDGRLYIAGGMVSGSPTANAYAYDPATGIVTSLASLPSARFEAGMVTGPDGRIYAIGGNDGSAPIADVLAYDLATNTWSPVASLPDTRAFMIADAGPDGRLYVIGGYNATSGWTTSAYSYDPATDTWATAPPIPSFRLYEGGAVGMDGRLYSLGNAGPSNQVDAFNPINTLGSGSATISVAKGNPTIAWANPGDILAGTPLGPIQLNASAPLSGTFTYDQPLGTVLQAGLGQTLSVTFTPDDTANYNAATATAVIDVLGPPVITVATPSVVVGQAMTDVLVATFTAPTFPGATPSDFVATITWADSSTTTGVVTADPDVPGRFLVAVSGPSLGTLVGSPSFQVTVDIAGQAIPGVWSSVHNFDDYLYYHAATTSGGKIYIIGGHDDDGIRPDVLAYDPVTQALTPVAPLPVALQNHAATTGPDGTIYVVGGDSTYPDYYLSTAYAYSPATDTWTPIANMPAGRDYLSAATGPDGKIYAIGGYDGDNYSNEVDAYDPATNTWSTVAPLPVATGYGAATTGPDGRIYYIGGYNAEDGYTSHVYAYDTATDTWSQVADLPVPIGYFTAGSADGLVYAIGGYNSSGYLSSVYAYDPTTDTWSEVAGLSTGLYSSAAATGPNGQLYNIGGYTYSEDYPTIDVLSKPSMPTATSAGVIALVAGPAASFVVTAGASGAIGEPETIVVTAYDAYGNVATGYSGPVQLTSSDPNAILPADPVLAGGVGTFLITFRSAGDQSFTVTDPEAAEVTYTGAVAVDKSQPVAGPLTASPEQPTYGESLTLSASYSVPGGVAGAVLGLVDFYDGDTYLGSASLVVPESGGAAVARFTIATLMPGSHNFRSVYAGDANTLPAESSAETSTQVTQAMTTTSLTATASSQEVTLVAAVATTGPAATGTVEFYDGETLVGTATIIDGVATLRVSPLAYGLHSFRAVFTGDLISAVSQASAGYNLVDSTAVLPTPSDPQGPTVVDTVVPPTATDGPRVIGLSRYGLRARRTVLSLTFDSPLEAASAANRGLYRITRRNGRRISVMRASYDEATNTVKLVTARGLKLTRTHFLTVSSALIDRSGRHLDGSGTGHPGTAFTAKIRWTALSTPGRSPAVTFADGQAHTYTGRLHQYVRNVLHTTLSALRRGSHVPSR